MAGPRLNPTLLDKLLAGTRSTALAADEVVNQPKIDTPLSYPFYVVPQIERFNETAMRATVRRELNWLLNTTNLDSAQKLEAFPHVRTSVLNYGLPSFTGKAVSAEGVSRNADQIRRAIIAFEPRFDPATLEVEPTLSTQRENAVTYLIRGDITSAVKAMPVQFVADVEIETGAATVLE